MPGPSQRTSAVPPAAFSEEACPPEACGSATGAPDGCEPDTCDTEICTAELCTPGPDGSDSGATTTGAPSACAADTAEPEAELDLSWERQAQAFAAMGSEARLQVLKTLVRAGAKGLAVGEIQSRTGIAPSTLAHHLKFLAASGVVAQERRGRTIINRADYETLHGLARFIVSECCADCPPEDAHDHHTHNAQESGNV